MILPLDLLSKYVEINESVEAVCARFVALGFESEMVDPRTLDLEVTPNRGDVLSLIGLAREYAASTGQTVTLPATLQTALITQFPDFNLELTEGLYHRLAALRIDLDSNPPSPEWLVSALAKFGQNPINLVVDLTNYVMLELGIPLHAFDIDRLAEPSLKLRLSIAGERFVSLKDETVLLPADCLVAESGDQLVDLVGIRGGRQAIVTPESRRFLVWAASLPRPLIRQAAKATGIRTEGSYRHERETDVAMVDRALGRFAYLLMESLNGQVGQPAIKIVDRQCQPLEPKVIAYDPAEINRLLGTDMTAAMMVERLTSLGFQGEAGRVIVPTWRHFDINYWQDLAEEIARLTGYSRLPKKVISSTPRPISTQYNQYENLKDQLVDRGFSEVYTESFAGRQETELGGWEGDRLAVLANPVNQEFAYCRPTLIPGLIKVLAQNAWHDQAMVFELGNVFPASDLEVTKLGLAIFGRDRSRLSEIVDENRIKLIEPNDQLGRWLKLRRPVLVAECELSEIKLPSANSYRMESRTVNYRPVSIFPPSVRDIAIVVDDSIAPETVISRLTAADASLIFVQLFDRFKSDKLGRDRQSLAIRLAFQSLEATLANDDVDQRLKRLTDILKSEFEAQIR